MSLRQDTAGERLLSRSDKADELLMTLTTARDVCRRLIRRGGSVTAPLSLSPSLSLFRARGSSGPRCVTKYLRGDTAGCI